MLSFLETVSAASGSANRALMEEFAEANPILPTLPFITEESGVYEYSQLVSLGDAGTRSLNSSRQGTESKEAKHFVSYKLLSDIMKIDWQIAASDPTRRAREELRKMRSFSDLWTWLFFNGSSDINPEEFDGLRAHTQKHTRQHLHNHISGAPLSKMMLRKAVTNTPGANAIYMSEDLHDWFSESAGTDTSIMWSKDELGTDILKFRGLPITRINRDQTDRQLLPSTEGSSDLTANDCTSVYVVARGEGKLQGINFKGPQGYGFNTVELPQTEVFLSKLVEWKTSLVIEDKRSATRLDGIKLGPITS